VRREEAPPGPCSLDIPQPDLATIWHVEAGDQPQPDFVDRAVERICRRIPGMDRGSLQSANAGYDGLTPDQRAILDRAGPEGFFLVCGFSGTGFKLAPAVGACMAEWIVDGAPSMDLSLFDPGRFARGTAVAHDRGPDAE